MVVIVVIVGRGGYRGKEGLWMYTLDDSQWRPWGRGRGGYEGIVGLWMTHRGSRGEEVGVVMRVLWDFG